MKAYGGSGCIDPHFLDLGTSWRRMVSFTPRPLNPRGKSPRYHWIRGWVDPRAGLDDVEKRKFLTLPGIEIRPPGLAAVASRYTDWAIPGIIEDVSITVVTKASHRTLAWGGCIRQSYKKGLIRKPLLQIGSHRRKYWCKRHEYAIFLFHVVPI
jgi:hypothetical protein